MPAYVIVETDIFDPEQYEQYKAASPAAVAAGGGRFVVRGGELTGLEGDWTPSRVVLLKFPDMAALKAFLNDPEYQPLKNLRLRAAETQMLAVEGI